MKEFIELWRTLAVQNGLKGVYFIGQTYHLKEEKERLMKWGLMLLMLYACLTLRRKLL